MRKSSLGAVAGLALALATVSTHAQFITPDDYGWSRGDNMSVFVGWHGFTSTTGGNTPNDGLHPDPLPAGWAEPDVIETTGTAIITGSGYIYSPFGPINVEVTVPNYGQESGVTTLLLQVSTQGNELLYGSVLLDDTREPTEIIELSRQSGDLGFEVETLFVFDVDGNADVYAFDLPTSDPHVSVRRIHVDTFTEADACTADFNADGSVNTQDVIAFLNAWNAGDNSADVNGDGSVNTQDVIAYLNLWVAGC